MTLRGHVYVGELSIETDGKTTTLMKDFHRSFSSVGGMQAAFKDAGLSSRIALVSCGAQKAFAPAKAKDLYTSNLFRAARAYAEKTCARWYILSAKHGLLDPETVIAPYEQRIVRGKAQQWGQRVGTQLDKLVPLESTVVMLAGEAYVDAIELPDDREMYWEEPLKGLGLGKRIQWLRANTPKSNPQPAEGR